MSFPSANIHVVIPHLVENPDADLTDAERLRAAAFHFEKDRKQWSACRAALRRILSVPCGVAPSDVPILLGPNGKPELGPGSPPLHFNLSHCDNLALVVLHGSPVGVDVEPLDRAADLLDCESSFCHPDEIAALPTGPAERAAGLLEIWTAKEAALKALGTGLLQPPQEIFVDRRTGTARSDRPLPGLEALKIERIGLPVPDGFSAFVAFRK